MTECGAGGALDAEIARRVFGIDAQGSFYWRADSIDGEPRPKLASLPHYSTDIAAAWQIVSHLGAHPLTLTRYPAQAADAQWYCQVTYERDGWRHWATGQAPTAPLAICRAALAAVGG